MLCYVRGYVVSLTYPPHHRVAGSVCRQQGSDGQQRRGLHATEEPGALDAEDISGGEGDKDGVLVAGEGGGPACEGVEVSARGREGEGGEEGEGGGGERGWGCWGEVISWGRLVVGGKEGALERMC